MKAVDCEDLMYKIAIMAKELGNETMDGLRLRAGYNCDTDAQARQLNKHCNRGQLIEIILIEECENMAKDLQSSFEDRML